MGGWWWENKANSAFQLSLTWSWDWAWQKAIISSKTLTCKCTKSHIIDCCWQRPSPGWPGRGWADFLCRAAWPFYKLKMFAKDQNDWKISEKSKFEEIPKFLNSHMHHYTYRCSSACLYVPVSFSGDLRDEPDISPEGALIKKIFIISKIVLKCTLEARASLKASLSVTHYVTPSTVSKEHKFYWFYYVMQVMPVLPNAI